MITTLPAEVDDASAARIHELRFHLAWHEREHHALSVELAELTDGVDVVTRPLSQRIEVSDSRPPLSVAELSAQLGRSVPSTYRLLEGGAIAARKTYPNRPSSRWIIPADAAEQFLARGAREEA
ncbi:MAG: hypothetical protein WKF41_10180 [Gaiellaceae bacterium]